MHPVTPAPIKVLPCLCFFPPIAEKNKLPVLRVFGDPEHYYRKRYKTQCFAGVVKLVDALDSKSSGSCIHVGSIPTSGTNEIKGLAFLVNPFFRAEIMDGAQTYAHLGF